MPVTAELDEHLFAGSTVAAGAHLMPQHRILAVGDNHMLPVLIDLGVQRRDRSGELEDRKSTRLNSSHANISYAVFCLKKKNEQPIRVEESDGDEEHDRLHGPPGAAPDN